MPGEQSCWRVLELSAKLLFGSGKGVGLHGTEVTYGKSRGPGNAGALEIACRWCRLFLHAADPEWDSSR
ncbi:MAG TPA: hypothetical protein VE109_00135, partial [Acidobacteriaceae bacterium]|nr:hypothetical protein [Acidobacteriaceae bacterium]